MESLVDNEIFRTCTYVVLITSVLSVECGARSVRHSPYQKKWQAEAFCLISEEQGRNLSEGMVSCCWLESLSSEADPLDRIDVGS